MIVYTLTGVECVTSADVLVLDVLVFPGDPLKPWLFLCSSRTGARLPRRGYYRLHLTPTLPAQSTLDFFDGRNPPSAAVARGRPILIDVYRDVYPLESPELADARLTAFT